MLALPVPERRRHERDFLQLFPLGDGGNRRHGVENEVTIIMEGAPGHRDNTLFNARRGSALHPELLNLLQFWIKVSRVAHGQRKNLARSRNHRAQRRYVKGVVRGE